jgi:hypothetical protein
MVLRGPKPATYPDIHMYRGDVPFWWKVTLKSDGLAVDISGSEISAPSSMTASKSGHWRSRRLIPSMGKSS